MDTRVVLGRLVIEEGPTVRLDHEPAQGTGHRVLFGVLDDQEQPVVVKIERTPGALERERTALAWLATARFRAAPRLIAFGPASLDGDPVICLVSQRCAGAWPTTVDAWWRMGQTVARLAGLDCPGHGLPALDAAGFVDAHRQRIHELGGRLDPFTGAIPDWAQLTARTLPASTPLVLTHGDPGPGNYLDTGPSGVLIDWEEAHIAPIGLDLARLMFIALLGSGPAGYTPREHHARASATTNAYLDAVQHQWHPADKDLRWWLTVAGIQFIHRRWQLGGPAPWQHAADVLTAALTSSTPPWG